jgi:hypothetical protein
MASNARALPRPFSEHQSATGHVRPHLGVAAVLAEEGDHSVLSSGLDLGEIGAAAL